MLRDRYSQPAAEASAANTMPRCRRLCGSTGSSSPFESSFDWGKLKPSGSFSTPYTK